MKLLYIDSDQEYVKYHDLQYYGAIALYPDDEAVSCASPSPSHVLLANAALRRLVELGTVTLRDPQSFLPLSQRTTGDYSGAVVSRADFQRFLELFGTIVRLKEHTDPPTKIGYTIRGAARALAKQHAISAHAMEDSIAEATRQEKLRVRDPETGMPYVPKVRSRYHERISIADLNEWLKSNGVPYELEDEPVGRTDTSLGSDGQTGGVNRNHVMLAFRVGPDEARNTSYWDERLSRPPKWLIGARMSPGKPGVSSRWDPLLVAHALLGRKAMSLKALDGAIRVHFPGSFEEWKEKTDDYRT